jgi:hypothetical protein
MPPRIHSPVDASEWLDLFKPEYTKEQLIVKLQALMSKHKLALDTPIIIKPNIVRGKKSKNHFPTLIQYAAQAENPILISAILELRMRSSKSLLTYSAYLGGYMCCESDKNKYLDIAYAYRVFTVNMDQDDFELTCLPTTVSVPCVVAFLKMPYIKQLEEQTAQGLRFALEGSDSELLRCLLQNCCYSADQYLQQFHLLQYPYGRYRPARSSEFTVESRRRLWLENIPKSCYGVAIINLLSDLVDRKKVTDSYNDTYEVIFSAAELEIFKSKLEEIRDYVNTLESTKQKASNKLSCF